VASMIAVSSMHEQVHERTNEQRQIDERTQDVGTVFCEQENADNDQEPEQNDAKSHRRERAAFSRRLLVWMVMQRHAALLFSGD
jgi:hypothetical protein